MLKFPQKPPWLNGGWALKKRNVATPQTSRPLARHAHSRVSRAFPVSIQHLLKRKWGFQQPKMGMKPTILGIDLRYSLMRYHGV